MDNPQVRRGELYWVDWNPSRGSEQAGRRPAVIVQTDAGNTNPNYPNTIIAALSTASPRVPTHVGIEPSPDNGLRETSIVKCEQIVTVSKNRLDGRIGQLNQDDLQRVDDALKLALSLT
jgi:mRNA interferase MazF